VPHAVLFDLEPGVINAVCASLLGEFFRPGSLVNQNAGAGNIWAKGRYTRAEKGFCLVLCVCGLSLLAVFILTPLRIYWIE
jgi:hypothetical protein